MILEVFGVIFGFVYLYLEVKQKKGMWIVGLLMAAVYAAVYLRESVYASMGFQIYYIVVSIYGFLVWNRDKLGEENSASDSILYRRVPLKVLLLSVMVYVAATASMVLVLGNSTNDPMPWADSSITVLSAIATFWLSKSYRAQWLVWLVVNTLTVLLAFRLQLYPTVLLYSVNAAASVYGYIHWGKRGICISAD